MSDVYLRDIIKKYDVNVTGVRAQVEALYPSLMEWGNGFLLEAIWSGSLAKGTGVSISTDADVFLSFSSSVPDQLGEIYESLLIFLQAKGCQPRRQNVSIGARVNNFKIDFVPGKRQSQAGYDHSLYKSKTSGWTKTNVKTHVSFVQDSGRQEEIRLVKIWRELHSLDFPSFYLELAVIDHLCGNRAPSLSERFLSLLEFFSTGFINARYVDPANSNNIISDDLARQEKTLILANAKISRAKKFWSEIVW
jgi:hypothetical protein